MFGVIANVFMRKIWSIVNLIYFNARSNIAIIVFHAACNFFSFVKLEALDNTGEIGMIFPSPIIWKRASTQSPISENGNCPNFLYLKYQYFISACISLLRQHGSYIMNKKCVDVEIMGRWKPPLLITNCILYDIILWLLKSPPHST